MKKMLCIAEKPSVMREIKSVYDKYGCSFGCIDFAAFHGHLMSLPDADFYDSRYKKWDKADLPIIPQFQYIEDDKKSCKELVLKIKSGDYDALINACDAGREGEHIFYSFYEGEKLNLPVYRFWASDVTEESLKKALNNLIDEKQFTGLRLAAKLRAQFDWLTGINFSRSASLQSNARVYIGRVQSPTLALVVAREKEIKNFKPQKFYEVKARFGLEGNTYDGVLMLSPDYKDSKVLDQKKANELLNSVTSEGVIREIVRKKSVTKPPSLYSLVELQKDAAKYFGYKADKTLNIAQSLYEKHKVLTYPRTESRFLPTAMSNEIWQHLNSIKGIPELKPIVDRLTTAHVDGVMKSKSYVDDGKITDHHAIIPTKTMCNMNNLSEDEKNIYILVSKRLLSIFLPPYVVEQTVVITETFDGSLFKTVGKIVVDKGYSILYSSDKKDVVIPNMKKDDKILVLKKDVTSGETKPPARYNTSTLLSAMQNVGNKLSSKELREMLRDTAGLGTSATRAEILKKLETGKFVTVSKQSYIPTDFGMAVVDNFGEHNVFKAELTAVWETKLRAIEDGNLSESQFVTEMQEFVKKETREILNKNCTLSSLSKLVIGKCPVCGSDMRSFKDYFVCDSYKKGENPCNCCFKKEMFGHRLTDSEMKLILSGKSTKNIEMSKGDKKWSAPIMLDKETKRLSFVKKVSQAKEDINPSAISTKAKICDCPNCGGSIYRGKSYYLCSSKNSDDCGFLTPVSLFGYNLTDNDVKEVCLNGQTSQAKKFIWKSGKSGFAKLGMKDKKIQIIF